MKKARTLELDLLREEQSSIETSSMSGKQSA